MCICCQILFRYRVNYSDKDSQCYFDPSYIPLKKLFDQEYWTRFFLGGGVDLLRMGLTIKLRSLLK